MLQRRFAAPGRAASTVMFGDRRLRLYDAADSRSAGFLSRAIVANGDHRSFIALE